MESAEELKSIVTSMFASQRFGVLATQREGRPHASLVCFAVGGDLTRLLFVTPRATRKYANLLADGRCALLVNNTANLEADVSTAIAVTANGVVSELDGPGRAEAAALYGRRHPSLKEFVHSPGSGLMQIAVHDYQIVRRFQEVLELRPES